MPNFPKKRWYSFHIVLSLLFIVLLLGVLAYFTPLLALIFFFMFIGIIYLLYLEGKAFLDNIKAQQETLKHRIKKTGEDVLSHLPIGIMLYNEHKQVEWYNTYLTQLIDQEIEVGASIYDVIPTLEEVELGNGKQILHYNQRTFEVLPKGEERLLYLTDVTEHQELLLRYHNEQVVLGIIHLDNLDEVTQGMDEQQRTLMLTQVTGVITDWATKLNIYLRRFSSDKFLAVFDQGTLEQLESSRFDILDIVRGLPGEHKIPLTLSIGVATGVTSLVEMGRLSQSSLDIALGRGGDQAAVKVGNRLSFYGGKSNAVEKRTRVRARVISHALRDLIHESDQVFVMGHVGPDMDSIGASVGVLKAVQVNKKEGYMVIEKPYSSSEKLIKLIEEHPQYKDRLLSPEEAIHLCTPRSLVIVVDTHRPSMVMEPKLLQVTKRVMVIDHHRRGEEFIEDPVLIYLEPYASSTSELVTELLQYQTDRLQMEAIEATSLLAGMVVDTRSFTYRTGSRTFEAASFLRRNGADSALVQRLLKEDMDHFIRRSKLVANAEMVFEHIAIAIGNETERYDQVLIAQAADTLLGMNNVKASFVIGIRDDEQIVISARSLGEINVQVIMEELGGGGHMTNAATQIREGSILDAKEKLLQVLQKADLARKES